MEKDRLAASKARINDLLKGKFFPGNKDDLKPGYVVDSFGRKTARVSIIGTVTDKFVSEDSNYMSVTIDDGSGVIRVKMFGSDVKSNSGFNLGDELAVVGKVKKYNEELYISPEVIEKVDDFNHVTLRKLEILKGILDSRNLADKIKTLAANDGIDAAKNYARENPELSEESIDIILSKKEENKAGAEDTVLKIIEDLGGEEGLDLDNILKESKLSEPQLDSIMTKLLDEGTIFEPQIGKFKVVG